MDGRITRGNKTKDKILYSTIELIADSGLESLSGSKIAEKAGISKSTIFHHFDTLENLQQETFTLLTELALEDILQFVDKYHEFSSFADGLKKIGNTFFNNENFYIILMAQMQFSLKTAYDENYVMPKAKHTNSAFSASIIPDLLDYFYSDRLSVDDKKEILNLIAMQLNGLIVGILVSKNKNDLFNIWQKQVDMIDLYIENKIN